MVNSRNPTDERIRLGDALAVRVAHYARYGCGRSTRILEMVDLLSRLARLSESHGIGDRPDDEFRR